MSEQSWRTIDSAPKNGTLVFAYWRQNHMETAYFKRGSWWGAVDSEEMNDPTHWMPLPKPPRRCSRKKKAKKP